MTPWRCPVCKAEVLEGSQCRRCRADLSLLVALRTERSRVLQCAEQQLAAGRFEDAAELARQADWLHSDADSRRLCATAYLMTRDFVAAWDCYCRWREDVQRGAAAG